MFTISLGGYSGLTHTASGMRLQCHIDCARIDRLKRRGHRLTGANVQLTPTISTPLLGTKGVENNVSKCNITVAHTSKNPGNFCAGFWCESSWRSWLIAVCLGHNGTRIYGETYTLCLMQGPPAVLDGALSVVLDDLECDKTYRV